MIKDWEDFLYGGVADYDFDGEVSDFELSAYFDDEAAAERAEREAASAYYYTEDDDWQDFCEDGSMYGLFPCNFDSQKEYLEALALAKENDNWQLCCEDGSEYDLDPYDFDSQEEYEEALAQAKESFDDDDDDDEYCGRRLNKYQKQLWQYNCKDGSEYHLSPWSFESKAEYDKALEQAKAEEYGEFDEIEFAKRRTKEQRISQRKNQAKKYLECGQNQYGKLKKKDKEILDFILNGNCLAADYLTCYGRFLFVEAVADNFRLPSACDFKEYRILETFEYFLSEVIEKDNKKGIQIWRWCIDNFYDHLGFAENAQDVTTQAVALQFDFDDKYYKQFVKEIKSDLSFLSKVLSKGKIDHSSVFGFAWCALDVGEVDVAEQITQLFFDNQDVSNKEKRAFIDTFVQFVHDELEMEFVENVKNKILPFAQNIKDANMQKRIDKWNRQLDDVVLQIEKTNPKYAYSRSNSWRAKYKGNKLVNPLDYDNEQDFVAEYNAEYSIEKWRSKYYDIYTDGVYPEDYTVEQDFLTAWQQAKLKWRDYWKGQNTFGLDVNDYEDHDLFATHLKQKRKEFLDQQKAEQKKEYADKKFVYCKVFAEGVNSRGIYYFPGELQVDVGQKVLVPYGAKEYVGTVVSKGECLGTSLPCHPDKIKQIIKIV